MMIDARKCHPIQFPMPESFDDLHLIPIINTEIDIDGAIEMEMNHDEDITDPVIKTLRKEAKVIGTFLGDNDPSSIIGYACKVSAFANANDFSKEDLIRLARIELNPDVLIFASKAIAKSFLKKAQDEYKNSPYEDVASQMMEKSIAGYNTVYPVPNNIDWKTLPNKLYSHRLNVCLCSSASQNTEYEYFLALAAEGSDCTPDLISAYLLAGCIPPFSMTGSTLHQILNKGIDKAIILDALKEIAVNAAATAQSAELAIAEIKGE